MLVAPLVVSIFQELSVSISVWWAGVWNALYWEHDVLGFEVEYQTQPLRGLYNEACLAQAQRERGPVLGRHAGYSDLFVPVVVNDEVKAVLVAGPFLTRRPTTADVLERWFEMSRSHGRMSDPAFSRYLAKTLETLTLEGPLFSKLEQLMLVLARLAGEQGDPQELATEAATLKAALLEARSCERMWQAVENMLDPRSARSWSTPLRAGVLPRLGLRVAPEHAIVGLAHPGSDGDDPLETALRRAEFQRAAVVLARRQGRVVAGRASDKGVILLAERSGGATRVTNELVELTNKLGALARKLGLRLYSGIARASADDTLPTRYRAALAAAEKSARLRAPFVLAEVHTEVPSASLRRIRIELRTRLDSGAPLSPVFGRYIEAVLACSGHEVETTRIHLDAGLERLLEPLLERGSLDSRSLAQLSRTIPQDAHDLSVGALSDAYRHVVAELERTLESPSVARHERSVRRALDFMREHLAEPLSLQQVSRVAGFAPDHFSMLLKRDLGVSFAPQLQRLRLERAKQLLASTSLSIARVAKLCGFNSRPSFQRLFKQAIGTTPSAYQGRQGS
jgi:AraC-like DNA-binding protein